MKYLIVVPDGAADEKIEALGGKTPLEAANLSFIDDLAAKGEVGMVKNVPPGVAPGSDAANLSVMGYDPAVDLSGRSPLEAVSLGIEMLDTDVAFRANLITLEGEGPYEELIVKDHSAGDITTEEADELIQVVKAAFDDETRCFYTGTGYRHCMMVHHGHTSFSLTPPHDILDQPAGEYLPKGPESQFITEIMKKSYELLKDHPVNLARIEKGLNPANSLWIWGQGKKPQLRSFYDKYKIKGAVISAVDLIKGIALCAGLSLIDVEGATGNLHTNFAGKADAAIREFRNGRDFVYIHVEGPDECSHLGNLEGKIACLQDIDQKIVKPVVEALQQDGEDFKVLVLPDHRTPLAIRTHTSEPVPYVIYRSADQKPIDRNRQFCEASGQQGQYYENGYALADYFFKK